MASMNRYVVGFLFDTVRTETVLIKKIKPQWQAGFLNGIGGKIEQSESPENAMSREFEEEAGVPIPANEWAHVLSIEASQFELYVFTYSNSSLLSQCKTMEKEEVVRVPIYPRIPPEYKVIPNLHWMIPLILDDQVEKPVQIKGL